MICLEKVYKSFDTPAGELPILRDTTLSIKPGAFVSLMGPSGSGKTTLMNLIAGLDHINSGTLTVYDTDLSTLGRDELTRWRGVHVSFVFQQFHLLPQLTVRENIDLVIDLNQLTRRYETEDILEKV
jgi:putative ABC transport system ATP-binding protein